MISNKIKTTALGWCSGVATFSFALRLSEYWQHKLAVREPDMFAVLMNAATAAALFFWAASGRDKS